MVSDKLSCGYGFWNFIVDFVERNLKNSELYNSLPKLCNAFQ